ncbi:PQQ-dependent sugar dehydrogenase [Rhizobium sp. NRK18]|uniref:PQQ-dependent sugar dehydrogenase n=1 Tax=Rhizobium sp. NRK18 TaxID=2964667 RepID=UPI003965C8C7
MARRKYTSLAFAAAAAMMTTAFCASAQDDVAETQSAILEVTKIADGLASPWSVEILPDGAYIISEKAGTMRIVRDGKVSKSIAGVPAVYDAGQAGLLDIALDADFAQNRRLYFTAVVTDEAGHGTAVYSATLARDESRLDDVQQIFLMHPACTTDIQFGSRIAQAPDGSLFFGIGDCGERDRAQDPMDDAGKILHINADGTIPADNPFAGGAKGRPEIWSLGHRNPQGTVIDPKDDRLFTVEHGARGGDEINMPEAGKNYGWPVITYGKDYSGADIGIGTEAEGYEQPLYYWDPSIAPGAIAVYHGPMFPEWEGDFLVAALKYQLIARLEREDSGTILSEERMLQGDYGRIRDVKVAPDGSIIFITDDENGALMRITRSNTAEQ